MREDKFMNEACFIRLKDVGGDDILINVSDITLVRKSPDTTHQVVCLRDLSSVKVKESVREIERLIEEAAE
jgi:uncharacterized protein YlzI (FlbEa/FlbD family)